jgi:CDP-diacylglycerol--serine O-phosphatidyltransferase
MQSQRPARQRQLSLARLVPNMITLGGLCCGLTGMRFAMLGHFGMAAMFIVIAAFIDGMDGRIARLLKSTSNFGAQLDSLSDIICFGVAPAIIIYLWQLQDLGAIGWAVSLFYVVCAALRLARFNAALNTEPQEPWRKKFFTGVPAPAGAMLALLPLTGTLAMGERLPLTGFMVAGALLIVGLLMSSRVPTISLKGLRFSPEWALPIMLVAGFWVVCLVINPWETVALTSIGYMLLIPVSIARFFWLARNSTTAA